MNSVSCTVNIKSDLQSGKLILSTEASQALNIIPGMLCKLHLSNREQEVEIVVDSSNASDLIRVDSYTAEGLLLPEKCTCKLRAEVENGAVSLYLGPVVGILTTNYTGNLHRPFSARTSLFRAIMKAGKDETTLIYLFTPEMIDWNRESIDALYLDESNKNFVQIKAPLPDIVYERIPHRRAERLASVKETMLKLKKKKSIQSFNQGFLDKHTVYKILKQNREISSNLPETYLSPSIESIKAMLEKHRRLFFKPINGSLGMGIFRVTLRDEKIYCRFNLHNKNFLQSFDSVESLLDRYFNDDSKWSGYLVQQGIDLSEYGGRPVDFRVHLNKDRYNSWNITALGAKAAGQNSITTHMRTGGHVVEADSFLNKCFGSAAFKVKSELNRVALKAADLLVESSSGPIGELGLDIGIDKSGNIWIFEVNSKPGRHIFQHTTLRESGKRAAHYITEYALCLSNFN